MEKSTEVNFNEYSPAQLKKLHDERSDLKDKISSHVNSLRGFYWRFDSALGDYSVGSMVTVDKDKSLEETKRDLLLAFEFGQADIILCILNYKPELASSIITSVEWQFAHPQTRELFTATYFLEIPHLVAFYGHKNFRECVEKHLRFMAEKNKTSKSGEMVKTGDYFSKPASWKTATQQGQRGLTPLFIALLHGNSSSVGTLTNVYDPTKLFPSDGFDMPVLSTINPYIVALQMDEYLGPFKIKFHPFSHLCRSQENQSMILAALQYSVDRALGADERSLVRFVTGDDQDYKYRESREVTASSDPSANPIIRAMVAGNRRTVELLMSNISSYCRAFPESLRFAVQQSVKGNIQHYLPFIKLFLSVNFLSNTHSSEITKLFEVPVIEKLSINYDAKKDPKIRLKRLFNVARCIQSAVLFVGKKSSDRFCFFEETYEQKSDFDPLSAMKKAAKLDIDFFNDLVVTHIPNKNLEMLNCYLIKFDDLRNYFQLLVSLFDDSPTCLKPVTLFMIAEGMVFYTKNKLDSLERLDQLCLEWAEKLYKAVSGLTEKNGHALYKRADSGLQNIKQFNRQADESEEESSEEFSI